MRITALTFAAAAALSLTACSGGPTPGLSSTTASSTPVAGPARLVGTDCDASPMRDVGVLGVDLSTSALEARGAYRLDTDPARHTALVTYSDRVSHVITVDDASGHHTLTIPACK